MNRPVKNVKRAQIIAGVILIAVIVIQVYLVLTTVRFG
jgi:hypothetical protein